MGNVRIGHEYVIKSQLCKNIHFKMKIRHYLYHLSKIQNLKK